MCTALVEKARAKHAETMRFELICMWGLGFKTWAIQKQIYCGYIVKSSLFPPCGPVCLGPCKAKDYQKRCKVPGGLPTLAEHPESLRKLYALLPADAPASEGLGDAESSTGPAEVAASQVTVSTEDRKPMPLPYFGNDNQEQVLGEVLQKEAMQTSEHSSSDNDPTDDEDTVEVARVVEDGDPVRIMSNGRKEKAVLVMEGERGCSGVFPPSLQMFYILIDWPLWRCIRSIICVYIYT